ncbi:TlpA family protein disulfide reductase [Sphingobacterium olei]|uniref:TlpA family protein disulfide reductase n=1 Tax=Sphingobacterium olei TaxID=2571155 RepID=A0A4U0NWZ3_9SPHI|nr:TlpA disulfide reductase family protein [Sphingobacterium olei]TJZ54764.1 TlpA family protein disulfide reductase [Sphingobacterium olei]
MKKILFIILGFMIWSPVKSQEIPVTLGIGDTAPKLQYAKWIQGTPFDLTQKDMVYVIEFWATWCGPCVAAMPHLSELAAQYKDEARFIGVNIWEKTGDKPYESSLPKVIQFVEGSKDRMTYNVIADNNELYMSNTWMRAAGQNGIPSTFVVKNNQIVWIGHPSKLDEIIPAVIADTFDITVYKAQFEKAKESSKATMQLFATFSTQVNEAVAAKDYDKAFTIIDESATKTPILAYTSKIEKLKILLEHFSEQKAIAYIKEITNAEKDRYEGTLASFLIERENLSKETYEFAATLVDKAIETYPFSGVYDLKAKAMIKAGNQAGAISALENAIALAKSEVNDPKFAGRVFDYTITEYQDKLKTLKATP